MSRHLTQSEAEALREMSRFVDPSLSIHFYGGGFREVRRLAGVRFMLRYSTRHGWRMRVL